MNNISDYFTLLIRLKQLTNLVLLLDFVVKSSVSAIGGCHRGSF